MDPLEEGRCKDLILWLEQHGGQLHPNLTITRTSESGLCIAANDVIRPEAAAVTVPASLCITTDHARSRIQELFALHATGSGSKAVDDLIDERGWVTLYLVLQKLSNENKFEREGRREKRLRGQSFDGAPRDSLIHATYVSLLPDVTLVPTSLRRAEVELLEGTPLYDHTFRRRRDGRERCRKAVRWLVTMTASKLDTSTWLACLAEYLNSPSAGTKQGKDDESADDQEEGEFDDETREPLLKIWRWAESMQASRAFPPRVINATGAPILIPVLDLFNHNRDAKVTWFHDVQTSPSNATVCLNLHYGLQSGQQAYNNYGPRPNEELFASYGFVDPSMKDDSITLKLPGGQQHYWRFGQRCPEELLEEVKRRMSEDAGAQQAIRKQVNRLGTSSAEGVSAVELLAVLQQILTMLMDKQERLYQSEIDFDSGIVREELLQALGEKGGSRFGTASERIRNEVVQLIRVYRKGQKRTLASAIIFTERDVEQKTLKLAP